MATFTPFLDTKPFFVVKYKNHNTKWLTPSESYDQDDFVEPCFEGWDQTRPDQNGPKIAEDQIGHGLDFGPCFWTSSKLKQSCFLKDIPNPDGGRLATEAAGNSYQFGLGADFEGQSWLLDIISFLTMEYWNQTLQYFLGARGIFHSTLLKEYTD